MAFKNTDGAVYYYVYNLQGDVVQLLDSSRNIVGEYVYGPYGYLENSSSLTTIARANPFRYRGYYYDSENGYYYLNARYYYPVFGRFISADDPTYIGARREITSYNLFSYCCNNPIALSDPSGTIAITTIIVIGAAVIGAGVALYTGYKMRQAGADWYDTIFYSVGNGVCAACTVGTLGLCAYDFYYDLSWYTGHVPVTEIGVPQETPIDFDADAGCVNIGKHLTGTGSPKNNATPNGSYTKIDQMGHLYSFTQYDAQGRQIMRIDYQGTSHAGVLPHIHVFDYNEMGPCGEYIYSLKWLEIK